MPLSLTTYTAKVIDTAKAGQPPEVQAQLSTMDAEVESMSNEALQKLAQRTASDSRLRHLLSKSFSLTLTNEADGRQYAAVDAAMLSEFLDYGSVRCTDFANNQLGTAYERVLHFADFISYLPPVFGYYCLHQNKIYVKHISSQAFTDSPTPLVVECSYVPAIAQVPDELQNDIVRLGADLLLAKVVSNA